jgi:quinol-cytochrome oxidoreductase complex cytochrome b subunit
MQLRNRLDTAYRWLDERMGLEDIFRFLRHKDVPSTTHPVWYYFGGISLFLFLIQVVTGILLLMYYRPGPDSSFESLQFIVSKVHFGWLVRDIHAWCANLMVLSVLIHMFSVFFLKSYRKPREMTWFSGMVLLSLVLGFGFSGYLLPWNELSLFATKVGTDMAGTLPVAGDFLLRLLRGGPDVSGATLSRFFGVHVAVLPGIFTAVLGFHLFLLQRQGISKPVAWEKLPAEQQKVIPFYPNFMLREMIFWMAALAVINALAVFLPWDLGVKADPFSSAPAGIRPEWYFMFMFQSLKLLPATVGPVPGELVGLAAFGVAGLVWFTLPLWDRTGAVGPRARLITWLGVLVLAYVGVMTVLGYTLP